MVGNSQATDKTAARDHEVLAQQLVTALFVLAKAARMYEPNNDSYRGQAARFFDLLQKSLQGRTSLTIQLAGDRLFVDHVFVTIDRDDRIGAASVLERWLELGMGGLVIGDSVTRVHIDTFLHLLWTFTSNETDPFELFASRLADQGADSISPLPRGIDESQFDTERRRQMRHLARNTFFQAISTVQEVMTIAARQEPLSINRTRRVIHSVIDQISDDDAALMELASIKSFDEYTYAHSTNVCIYSLTIGFRLGLTRPELSSLGFAALFHDIGKIKLPAEMIRKPDAFNEFDWEQMRWHPVYGAMTLGRALRLDNHSARAMAVAFEHHITPDYGGYPTLPEQRPLNMYSRIVAIADSFDALTSGRVYIKRAFPPDEALSKMLYQMQSKYDPFLLKLFVNIIGIFPVGSLALLSNESLALVTKTNPAELHRPEVRIIADRNGKRDATEWLDLADPANRSIEIMRLVNPDRYGLDLAKIKLTD